VKGHLHLACARGADGASYLREQSFRAPLHLSKPHEDAGALVVNLVNPTAGIFDDDEIEINVSAEEGASLVLTTPSSSRVYRSRDGGFAKVHQTLSVMKDAFVEFYPEPFIPHAGARYHQHNTLRAARGASLVFFEWLSPGRVASGEAFRYDELRWDTRVFSEDQLIAKECYTLRPDDRSLDGLRLKSETPHYLGCFVLGDFDFPEEAVEALGSESVYLGCGRLSAAGWVIKAVCSDALQTRNAMAALRGVLYQAMGRAAPSLGRF
jgi:urease accessory protein